MSPEVRPKDAWLPSWWTFGATLLAAVLIPVAAVLLIAALGAIFA